MCVTLSGTIHGKALKYSLDFSLKGEPSETSPIHRLTAKAKIKELQDEEGNKASFLSLTFCDNKYI